MRFSVWIDGEDRLGLRELCDRHVNDLWVPTHLSTEQAAHFALDHVKRTLARKISRLAIEASNLRS